MNAQRRTSAAAGVLFLITHVTSVTAIFLYGAGAPLGPDTPLAGRLPVLTGALLDIVLAAAVVGTAVALYPLLRGYGQGLSIAYVALRTLEAGVILTGVVVLLPVVATPGHVDGPGLSPDVVAGLRLTHDWTFLVGPGLICPINTVVLAWLLHREHLVPRAITALGLFGGPLIAAANLGMMFGLTQAQPVAGVPIFAWEISLAIYLIIRGIRSATEGSTGALPVSASLERHSTSSGNQRAQI